MKQPRGRKQFLRRHSLSLTSAGIVILWTVLYAASDPSTHLGAFFGNAIADWTGVVVTVLMTIILGGIDVLFGRLLQLVVDIFGR